MNNYHVRQTPLWDAIQVKQLLITCIVGEFVRAWCNRGEILDFVLDSEFCHISVTYHLCDNVIVRINCP